MKVLFAYINTTKSLDMPLGIAYLSAMLKTHGHRTGLLDLTWKKPEPKDLKGYDLLAVSCSNLEFREALLLSAFWKVITGLPVVFGGCKATIEPQETLLDRNNCIDAVCRGEGEEAFLEFVQKYEAYGVLPTDVDNFWVKSNDTVSRRPLRHLTENLDTLPFPDRTIFDRRHIELRYPGTTFLSSRGCPFHCSMCVNHYLQKLYRGLGNYTRFRSVDNLLEEIKQVKNQYNLERIFFIDDTFTVNQKRLGEFCQKYKREIDLPFLLMGRCNTVTKDLILKLKDAGCIYIGYGVESGNYRIRNHVLNRDMSEEQIVNAFQWTREAGIKTASYNMIGIPSEKRKMMMDTVKLNHKIRPDVVQTTLLYPFPKTEIYDMAKADGLLIEDNPLTEYYTRSVIKIEGMNSKQLFALEQMVPYYVKFPRFLWGLVRVMEWIMTKTNRLNKIVAVYRRKVLDRKFYRVMK
jgi:radical SAM superfamily enzyme YgiQ (UPF0313 family)